MRIVAIAMALAVAACGQPTSATSSAAVTPAAQPRAISAPAAANNCPATATSSWSAGGVAFNIEATAAGATCADATAIITIRDANGAVIHTATYASSGVPPLAEAESLADMQRRLGEWITPAGAAMDSTGDLAAWAADAPRPIDADVPFLPSEGVTRPIYEALRAADGPMYCYQQSAQSGLCFAIRDGALKELGQQTYAG